MDPVVFEQITGKNQLNQVLEGLKLFEQTNIRLKINVVSLNLRKFSKDCKENYLLDLVEIAKNHKIDVRFIEVMPIGYGKLFQTINHEELIQLLSKKYVLEKDETKHGFGPATYYTIPGFKGSIGFISAIHNKFCDACNRVRLTSTGDLKPCLCYETSVNIRKAENLLDTMSQCIFNKPKAHCFEDVSQITENKNMNSIGG